MKLLLTMLSGVLVASVVTERQNRKRNRINNINNIKAPRNDSTCDEVCTSEECILAASVLLQSMNRDIEACDDFYQYACGNWAKYHHRRDSENALSWFHEINVDVSRSIPEFLESKTTLKEPKIIKQIRKMYKACKQSDERELHHRNNLRLFHLPKYPAILAHIIENINEPQLNDSRFAMANYTRSLLSDFNLIDTIAQVKKLLGVDIFFKFDIVEDPSNRTRNRIYIDEPSRFWRVKYGHKAIADWILDFVSSDPYIKLQSYSSVNKSSQHYARQIIKNRNSLAELSNKAATNFAYANEAGNEGDDDEIHITSDLFDDGYINVTVQDLQNATKKPYKKFWHKYLTTIFRDVTDPPVDISQQIILTTRSGRYYLQHLMDYFIETPKYELQLYIWWAVIEEMLSNTFNEKTNDEDEETKAKLSRSCASYVNKEMEMAVNYGFAESIAFDKIKSNVTIMLDYIRAAFNESVERNAWMDNETKLLAWEKANAMKTFIGFPEWLKTDGKLDEYYEDLTFDQSNHFANLIVARKLQMTKTLKKLNATVETEWACTPLEVNAFYSPSDNAITIPLAILQFPLYHLGLEALNYGATGSTIGHELTHGFDDTGVQFDKDGNQRKWWTEDASEEFKSKSECFVKQYNGYHLSEINANVKGNLTLGENIADAGGLRQAYHAYNAYIRKYGSEKRLPGFESFSHEQLFFLSYANSHCETQTKSYLQLRQIIDEHSPARFRVNGVLENSKEFKNAFECSASSKMVSRDPCHIW